MNLSKINKIVKKLYLYKSLIEKQKYLTFNILLQIDLSLLWIKFLSFQ